MSRSLSESLVTDREATSRGLSELVWTVPEKLAHAARVLFLPGTARPRGSGIRVPPLSLDWLRSHELDHSKH